MPYVQVLRDKRQEVLAEIEALRTQATELGARLAAKEGQLRNLEDLLALESGGGDSNAATAAARPRGTPTTGQRFTDAAVDLLAAHGAPVHYQDLARMLAEHDVYVPGKDPAANLIAHMLRDPRFGRAAGRGMYGLAGWPSVGASRSRGVKKAPSRRRAVRSRSVSRAKARG